MMKLTSRLTLVAGVFASLTWTTAAHATTITTTNFNTWKSSTYITGAPTEANFYSISSSSYGNSSGITLTGGASSFNFTGVDNGAYYLIGDGYGKTLSGATDSGSYININFSGSQNAFLLGFANTSSIPYTITLSDGESFTTSTKLFGLSLSSGVTSAKVSTVSGFAATINDFYFGNSALPQDSSNPSSPSSPAASATPEPASFGLLAGGGLIIVGARKRFGRAAAKA